MKQRPWVKLTRFLQTDPEIVALKNKYHALTGKYLPGWNWDEYASLDDYIATLRRMVEAEESKRK